jgi:hypothetical protein
MTGLGSYLGRKAKAKQPSNQLVLNRKNKNKNTSYEREVSKQK